MLSSSNRNSGGRRLSAMGKVTGFLEIEREDRDYAPVEERIKTLSRICPAAA